MTDPVDCIFCRIVAGEIPAYTIYDDDKVLAFLDIHPASTGHTMVIPKQHFERIDLLPDDIYIEIMKSAKKVTDKINLVLEPDRIAQAVIGLDVDHAHLHLIPIAEGDELKIKQDFDAEPDHTNLSVVSNKLKLDKTEDS